MAKILPGFVKGQSDNLPKIDAIEMFQFMRENTDFMGAEIRGIKAKRSGRGEYGDNAIGYVQVSRNLHICTVKAKVTPEHSIAKKGYNVTLICNEVDEKVISVQCEDCAASLGGCKHAIALLTWIHRRSEEPAVTSVSCYWKKSKLSTIGTSLKFLKGKDLGKGGVKSVPVGNGSFLKKVLEESETLRCDTVLTKYHKDISDSKKLSIHQLLLDFFKKNLGNTADEFIQYSCSQISERACNEASNETLQQTECNLWFELRYARITASIAHESAHCHTLDGSLVERILGASSIKETAAMARGKKLESEVRTRIEKLKEIKISMCGFKVLADHAIMGASPDGISAQYVIEIKCPSSEKAMKRYVCNGKLTEKCEAQIQLQMLAYEKSQGLFCIASSNFEKTKHVHITVVDFNKEYCEDILNKCTTFWKTAVFPVLKKNFN